MLQFSVHLPYYDAAKIMQIYIPHFKYFMIFFVWLGVVYSMCGYFMLFDLSIINLFVKFDCKVPTILYHEKNKKNYV